MGCCVSSNKTATSSLPTLQPPKPSQNNETSFQLEEEKVKEVLTETPKLNPKNITKSKPPKQHLNIKAFDKFKEEQNKVHEKKALSINKDHDTSETWRLRKTMPTTTIEKTGKRVTGYPIKLLKNCSFPGDVSDERRDRTVNGSRNFGSVRMVQCREQVGQKMVNEGTHRRRDPGENSFRRTRSPATHTRLDPSWVGFHLQEKRIELQLQGQEQRCRRKVAGKQIFRPWRVKGLVLMSLWKIHSCHWNVSFSYRILKFPGDSFCGGVVAPPVSHR